MEIEEDKQFKLFHITDSIKNKVYQAAKASGADIVISEIGGTVGDIELNLSLKQLDKFAWNKEKKM